MCEQLAQGHLREAEWHWPGLEPATCNLSVASPTPKPHHTMNAQKMLKCFFLPSLHHTWKLVPTRY